MAKPSTINFGKRTVTAGGFVNDKYKFNGHRVINKTGSSIAADKLVAVVGYDTTAKLPKIVLADADVSTHTDVYVTLAAVADNAEGFVFKGGLSAATLDTNSATAAGDSVYLSTTAGAFAHTAPTGGDDRVLPIGWVTAKSATVGQIHWNIGEFEKLGTNDLQPGGYQSPSATTPIGYSAGAGGTVTQITSASTGVTLSKTTGQITTVALTTAAAAEEVFTVTNTTVAAADVVVLTTTYAGAGTPIVYCKKAAAGSFDIAISNLHAANALDALMVINFVVLKGQTA